MTEHIQIITFALAGLSAEDYRAHCEAVAPQVAALPGLRSKVWLADPWSGTYGGIYHWRERTAMRAYLDGPVFATLGDHPGVTGVTARAFEVLSEPSRVTAPSGT